MADATVTADVLRRCGELGFARAGIASARPTEWGDELRAWIGADRHGEMAYLRRHLDLMLDPERLLPGARCVICVADRYHDGGADAVADTEGAGPRGRIARYARGRDYHDVIRRRLHALCDELRAEHPDAGFRVCVDTAPLLEREYAQRAGLGAVGKNTLVIERGLGSYILLGEVLTTLDLAHSEPAEPDPCGSCTRCLEACPTDAITPWSVDATKCISYLTIEHRTAIDDELARRVDDWIFGCDVCQEVCPHNHPTELSRDASDEIRPEYAPRRTGFDIREVLGWSEADRREAFTTSAMKRARLAMMKRNALVVAGNALARNDDPDLRSRVETIAGDDAEDELVRATARTVLER